MPRIELIPEVLYDPLQPYHYLFDNLPLRNILDRQTIINLAVDLNADSLRNSVGSAGTLGNRLNVSLNANGSLKKSALDAPENISDVVSYQAIGAHADGVFDDGSGAIAYVRMLESERDKLSLVSDDANELILNIETISTTVAFDDTSVTFSPTDTITIDVEAPSTIKFRTTFPASAAHAHFYDQTPNHETPSTPNYKNYTTPGSVEFVDGSLRVYINGVRIGATNVYVPPFDLDGDWTLTRIASTTPASGDFVLNRALTVDDIIRIDFDIALT